MTPSQSARLLALVTRAIVLRAGGGNPNHDDLGRFSSSPGGHGQAKGRRRRQSRRKRRLREALRKKWRGELKAWRRQWAGYRKGAKREAIRDRERLRKGHAKERADFRGAVARERAELKARHATERREQIESTKEAIKDEMVGQAKSNRQAGYGREETHEDKARIREQHKAALKEGLAELEAVQAGEREELAASHRRRRDDLSLRHENERADAREDRERLAEGTKEDIAREKEMFRRELREDIEAHGLRQKTRGKLAGHGRRGMVGLGRRETDRAISPEGTVDRRLGPRRTHKAGSAESILRHCLRSLGLSARWRRGELTDAERLGLLDAVREYSRAWLWHEAEQLFRWHGRGDDGHRSFDRADLEALHPVSRALPAALRHHVGRFFRRVSGFLHEAILAGAMALNGPGPLDDADLAEVDRQHAVQVAFLDRFAQEVAINPPAEFGEPSIVALAEPMTAAEFAKRASDYAGAVWVGAQAVNRGAVIRGGKAVREARFHRKPDPEKHACSVCLGESNKGFVPVGTLLPIGDSTCLGMFCDCYFVYEMADGTTFITARGWSKAA